MRISDERTFGYTRVDNSLIDDGRVDIYAQSVYTALCRYASNTDRTCYPSADLIAKSAKCSRRKVFDSLKVLEELGYIGREQRIVDGQKRSSIYRIMGACRALPMCTACTTAVHDVHYGSAQGAHRTRPNEPDLLNYDSPPVAPRGDRPPAGDPGGRPSGIEQGTERKTDRDLGEGEGSVDTVTGRDIMELWKDICPDHPQPSEWTKARAGALRERIRGHPERKEADWWRKYFSLVEASGFLSGRIYRDRPFVAPLDWVMRPANMTKILEGNYADRNGYKGGTGNGNKNNDTGTGRGIYRPEREFRYVRNKNGTVGRVYDLPLRGQDDGDPEETSRDGP